MKISLLTLFPEMFTGPFDFSIVKRAQTQKKLELNFINLRDFGLGKYKQVDDRPYGGGVGMVMRVDVIASALANSKLETRFSARNLLKASNLKLRGRSRDRRASRITQA